MEKADVGQLKEADWTVDPVTGRCNSSKKFQEVAAAVARLIRDEAHSLIAGRAEDVATVIVAHLAHKHGLAPRA